MRLASLACSNTEIVCALGRSHLLVAVDSHSDVPEVAHLPRLGPDLNIDVDALIAARPDLVLSSLSVPGMERVVAAVEAAGLNQLVLDPRSWEDVLRDLGTVGAALGVGTRAAEVVSALTEEVESLARTFEVRPRVAVEWWPKPIIVAAGRSWITDMLELLGAENAFAGREGSSAVVGPGELRGLDLLVLSWCGARKLRPEVAHARGLGVRVACIPESALGRPGPRLIEGVRALAAALSDFS